MIMIWILALFVQSAVCVNYTLPDGFRLGIATASYQIEGAWNVSDKGENVWDHLTHNHPEKIADRSTGDVACDSYHNYKRDVQMLKELGVSFYRFSLSWSRILPKGLDFQVSKDGIDYYNNLINELIANDIEPMVTLFHWDTPQVLQEIGGWTNPLIVELFEDYARVAFENFGDRVKEWITFNEPLNMCLYGYGSRTGFVIFAPDMNFHGYADYLCGHNLLKAHARVYHLYDDNFRAKQKGKIGMASLILWAEPETDSEEDIAIAEKGVQFTMGWLSHPVFSKEGDYPEVMKKEIAMMSKRQGFRKSRLPEFTKEEVEYIRGSFDYIGINYYTSIIYKNDGVRPENEVPSHENDLGHYFYQGSDWETGASSWLKLRPEGLTDSLRWVVREYGDHEIYITENGYSSKGGLYDPDRVKFYNDHIMAVLNAIYKYEINVTAYTAWSLMDNFEWTNGYKERFGMYQVDFNSPNKTRTPRMSALVYKEIGRTRTVNYSYIPDMPKDIDVEEPEIPLHYLWVVAIVVLLLILIGLTYRVSRIKKSIRNRLNDKDVLEKETL